jgi:hypothetical protein
VEISVPNGTSSWLVNLCTWVWGHWNHVGACWITLCGFVCSGVIWAGSGGRTHSTTCRTVLEGGGGPLSTKWNYSHGWSHLSTWVWTPGTILVPVGSLSVVSGQCELFFGLDLVVGPTPPPGTVLEGGGGPFSCTKWNYSSWLINHLGLGPC